MKDLIGKLIGFLKETRAETRKVVWPERRYVMVATVIILILVVVTGLYVMTVDLVFAKIFGFLLK
ncbi:MAG: preprotein translocase subunit SecE [bacterium]|nr:preprotein translocase subunit SecE [Candidatus Margulisiibacteriota bacterium]